MWLGLGEESGAHIHIQDWHPSLLNMVMKAEGDASMFQVLVSFLSGKLLMAAKVAGAWKIAISTREQRCSWGLLCS